MKERIDEFLNKKGLLRLAEEALIPAELENMQEEAMHKAIEKQKARRWN